MNAFTSIAGIAVRTANLFDPAERARIEDFLDTRSDCEPFHRPAWSRAVQRGCGQQGHYLIATDARGIQAVLPLTEMRSPLFGSALVSSGFGVGGGVLGETAKPLAEAAVELARKLSLASVELRGGDVPKGWQVREGTYAGFARDLPHGDEPLLKAIPRKQRAEVRRAQNNGLEVRVGRSAHDLRDHYRVYSESVRNLGTPVFPRALFQSMLDEFGDEADILTVSKEGRPVASVFSFYGRNTVYPYWGGGVAEARALRANEHLYFELMRHAAARGCTRFDFGRSKVDTGAYAYKKNWGFEPRPLSYAVQTLNGSNPRELNPLSPKYQLQVRLWQKLPLPVANLVGPWISRGLG